MGTKTTTKDRKTKPGVKQGSVKKTTGKNSVKKKSTVNKPSTRKKTNGAKSAKALRMQEKIRRTNQRLTIILFAVSILMLCLIFVKGDHLWRTAHDALNGLFGVCAVGIPILMIYISVAATLKQPNYRVSSKIWTSMWLIIVVETAIYIYEEPLTSSKSYIAKLGELYNYGVRNGISGLVGGILGIPFLNLIGGIGSKITIVLVIFVLAMIFTGTNLMQLFELVSKPVRAVKESYRDMCEAEVYYEEPKISKKPEPKKRRINTDTNIDIDLGPDVNHKKMPQHPVLSQSQIDSKTDKKISKLERLKAALRMDETTYKAEERSPINDGVNEDIEKVKPVKQTEIVEEEDMSGAATAAEKFMNKREDVTPNTERNEKAAIIDLYDEKKDNQEYTYPPISLLTKSEVVNQEDIKDELQSHGQMLVDTLKSFGVQTKIVDISRGPAVTRFELQPATGVKISKITNLSDDIALNLAASGVRIEAPIPGKAAVGIEVPNKTINVVKMRELIESSEFMQAKSKLSVALGRDIAGDVTIADLAKMPHMLIAGSTGSGKSVCINSLVVSLLYKSSPEEVRFLMIDPKVVELGIYNGIPHLLVPVVTDPRKAAGALNWAVTEMLKRYKMFAEYNVRNLESYNDMVRKLEKNPPSEQEEDEIKLEFMPQIVIIIDELSDLMMAAPKEVEDSICRLAQMARAAGMHLVIATQRPSVDVITGIIKANIPSRIAFAVSSQIDSRTILDMGGAEKLLGRGDMLFYPIGAAKPIRVQGCFVTNEEIEAVTDFVKNADNADYDGGIIEEIEKNAVREDKKGKNSEDDGGHSEDPMLHEAIKCVVEAGQASTSLLQRRLRVGYARAGRLIDEMEQMSIIGPHEGSKARQVLMTYNEWLEMNMQNADESN